MYFAGEIRHLVSGVYKKEGEETMYLPVEFGTTPVPGFAARVWSPKMG